MKERFGSIAGFVVAVVAFVLCALPLYVVGAPWWLWAVWAVAFISIPFISELLDLGLWIWGLVTVINGEQTAFSIVYYVLAAISIIILLIQLITYLVGYIRDR